MRTFLATVLSVIALGVMLIAYGLLAPQLSAAPTNVPATQAAYVGASGPYAEPYAANVALRTPHDAPRAVVVGSRAPRRDWKKTALVIGGSTAAGAGIGGIIGGGKGAAIGAAIGGGVSTLVQALK